MLSVALLAACTSSTPAPTSASAPVTYTLSPAASPSAAPPSAATPTPTVAGPSVATLTREAARTKLTAAALGATRAPVSISASASLVNVCGGLLDSDDDIAYQHLWLWNSTRFPDLEHGVHVYRSVAGKEVVSQVRDLAKSCVSYTSGGDNTIQHLVVNGTYALPAPHGVDGFYAFCETSTTIKPAKFRGQRFAYCNALMSRGAIVVSLRVSDLSSSVSAARSVLARAVPITAKALVAAVPAS